MQDGRNTSRSQEINVNSFNEDLSSSDRTGRRVETEVNQTRSFEDNKSLNFEQTHERTGWLVNCSDAVHHEIKMLNTDNELLRERIEADMDFKLPGLPHSIVKHAHSTSVRQLIQKIENHPDRHVLQQDLRQNQKILCPEPKQTIQDVGNIELCELLETEPKTQCTVCLYTGTLASSIARAGTSCVKEEVRISKSSSTRWTFFQFLSTSSTKDDLTDTDTVRSWETRNIIRLTSWRRSAKSSSRVSMIDSYEMKNSAIEWLKMVETKCLSTNGCSCGWRSYSPCDCTRILPLQEWLVASFEQDRFQYCASGTQT